MESNTHTQIPSLQINDVSFYLAAGSDYSATVTELSFTSTTTSRVIQVPITQDEVTELTERFRASLTLVEANGIQVTVSPSEAMVQIDDDDGEWKNINFSLISEHKYFKFLKV